MIIEITDKSKNNYKGNPNRAQENLFDGTLAKGYLKYKKPKVIEHPVKTNEIVKVLNPDGTVKATLINGQYVK